MWKSSGCSVQPQPSEIDGNKNFDFAQKLISKISQMRRQDAGWPGCTGFLAGTSPACSDPAGPSNGASSSCRSLLLKHAPGEPSRAQSRATRPHGATVQTCQAHHFDDSHKNEAYAGGQRRRLLRVQRVRPRWETARWH